MRVFKCMGCGDTCHYSIDMLTNPDILPSLCGFGLQNKVKWIELVEKTVQ